MSIPPPVSPPPPPGAYGVPPRRNNTPWIVLGVVLGGGCCLGVPVLAAILFPVFAQAREAAKTTRCLSNVKQQALAHLMYANDNDGRFVDAEAWMDKTAPVLSDRNRNPFRCPSVPPDEYGYGMNRRLSSKPISTTEDLRKVVLTFESQDTGRNATGDPQKDAATPPRHVHRNNASYADGHAARIRTP